MVIDSRPNYFLLLEIDPDEPWDGTAGFEKRLQAKRSAWSMTVLNGVKTSKSVLDAQRALDLYDDIKRVLTDPILREQERADAHRRLADERLRRRADFDRDLRILMIKGFAWDAEVAEMRRNYRDLARDPELANRLDGLPTRAIAEHHAVPDQLEPSRAKVIRSLLNVLGEESLYSLLATVDPGITRQATLDQLTRAANTLYQQTQQDTNKTDPRVTARQELSGHAMQVFRTVEERDRYDNTLDLAPVAELIAIYQSALAAIKRFEGGQVEQFLTDASSAGVDRDVALAMMLKHFEGLKWTVQLPVNLTARARRDQVQCGACQAWNVTESRSVTMNLDRQGRLRGITGSRDDVVATWDAVGQVQPSRRSPSSSGSFYLTAFLAVVAILLVAAQLMSIWAIIPVVVGGLLGVWVVGAHQLRHDDKLSEPGFLSLMVAAVSKLLASLVRRNADATTEPVPDEYPSRGDVAASPTGISAASSGSGDGIGSFGGGAGVRRGGD